MAAACWFKALAPTLINWKKTKKQKKCVWDYDFFVEKEWYYDVHIDISCLINYKWYLGLIFFFVKVTVGIVIFVISELRQWK